MPLDLSLKPSPSRLGLLFLHLLPALCLLGSGVPSWVRVVLPCLTGISLLWNLVRLKQEARCRLSLLASGEAFLWRGDDQKLPIVITMESCIVGWIQVFAWRSAPEVPHVRQGRICLMRDGMSASEWRHLRTWLRWRRPKA